jgi:hypothetical protein
MRVRIFLAAGVAAVGAIALAGAAFAAGGGFGAPGTTAFRDVTAYAGLVDTSNDFLSVSVDRGVQTFLPKGGGGPVMTGPQTTLSYSETLANGTVTGGCFIIPDSAFAVSSGLATAVLKADPTVETPCPGVLVPAGAGGRPGLVNVVPEAGGGGGGMPITVDLVWTSNGAIMSGNGTSNSRCQGVSTHAIFSSTSTFASVSGTADGLTGPPSTQYATVQILNNVETISGVFSNACLGI